MTMQCCKATTGADVPEVYHLIVTPTGKRPSIRTEGDGPYSIGVVVQNPEAMTGMTIPQANSVIVTATCKQTSIRAESERPYSISMPMTGKAGYTIKHVIDPNLAGGRSCGKQMPLWTVCNCKDVAEGVGEH
jgi:hypothetical protein